MEIRLDPDQGFVTNDGKFDQKKALKNAGVKAAVCFKEPIDGEVIAPWDIRNNESEETLIVRGLNTIFSDHTTPSEHAQVGLEITGIPKILCMILNNEHQYTTDERSLRYTEVEPNEYLSDIEVENYNKWLNIFQEIITKKYFEFYRKFNKSEEATKKAIKKLAQENARYQVTVFMPTVLTYTVPFIQINKIASYMERIIANPMNEFEKLLIPYMQEFITQLKDLKVLITEEDVTKLLSEERLEKMNKLSKFKNSEELLYKNNKEIELSLFADRNKFTGINLSNFYSSNISYNHFISFACLAQEHRHRTVDCEMQLLSSFNCYVPPIIKDDKKLLSEWYRDMEKVIQYHPQGELIKVNTSGTLKNIIQFVSKERCCDRAQQEIEDLYANQMIPDIYEALMFTKQEELAAELRPYVKRLRCCYPTYNCPNPCGHPRLKRDL